MTTFDPNPQIEPEFADRYREIMIAWQSGEATADNAEAALENLLEEAVDSGNRMNQGGIELNLGIIEGYLANFVVSARHFETAKQHFSAEGARQLVITCDLNIGENYRLMGDFQRAQKFFRLAYDYASELNNARMMATALTNEGQMWLSAGSVNKARACLNEAVEIAKNPYPDEQAEHIRMARFGVLAEIYHALTQIALIEDDADVAWIYARHAYDYARQTKQPMHLGYGNRAIADAITALGHSPEDDFNSNPDEYYKLALANFQQVNMEGDIAKTYFARGNSLLKRGKKAAAAKLYQRALAIFSKYGMSADVANVAEAQMHATG